MNSKVPYSSNAVAHSSEESVAEQGPLAITDSQFEEASTWYARLREPARPVDLQLEFNQWLAADPPHQQAFRETEQLWQALQAPVVEVIKAEAHASGRNTIEKNTAAPDIKLRSKKLSAQPSAFLRRITAIAACLVVVVVGSGLFWQNDIAIQLNSDYATGVGEKMPLQLSDGSRIALNTNSAITVELQTERRHVRLLKGEAWFDVSPNDSRPFFVETSQGLVRVTGTSFGVQLRDEQTLISLTEGQVELTLPAHRLEQSVVALAPGQQASFSAAGISAIEPFDVTQATAWLRGQLVFYDTPLAEVVSVLNRYRSGHIVVLNDELEQLKVSGVFATADTNAALNVIADTLPVQLTRLTDYLVVLR